MRFYTSEIYSEILYRDTVRGRHGDISMQKWSGWPIRRYKKGTLRSEISLPILWFLLRSDELVRWLLMFALSNGTHSQKGYEVCALLRLINQNKSALKHKW